MPVYRRQLEPGQLQFIATTTYRRAILFDPDRFPRDFVEVLRQLRQEVAFPLIGWVLMPEHFHRLIKPEAAEATSRIRQELKKRAAAADRGRARPASAISLVPDDAPRLRLPSATGGWRS